MLKSAIYTGQVFHKRYGPKEHTLQYNSFFLLLALEELPHIQNVSKLFAWNRRAWFSFHDADFGKDVDESNQGQSASVKKELENLLSTRGLRSSDWRFEILTMPRTLGYAFNPISVIYCRDSQNTLKAMIYEVNNTFGERIHYVIPVDVNDSNKNSRIRQQCSKELFVSPFFDMQGYYAFDVSHPNRKLNFKIDYLVGDELKLRASFSGIRHHFTPENLRSLALHYSGTTYKVILGIHWEAVKLWWKGLSLVNHVPLVMPEDEIVAKEAMLGSTQSNTGKITYKPHNYSTEHATRHSADQASEQEQP